MQKKKTEIDSQGIANESIVVGNARISVNAGKHEHDVIYAVRY